MDSTGLTVSKHVLMVTMAYSQVEAVLVQVLTAAIAVDATVPEQLV